jgi:hypothetical protein
VPIQKFGPISLAYPNGAPLTDEPIEVREKDTGALADLYTSLSGGLALENPTSTTELGELSFFAEVGAYTITVLESDFTMTVVVYDSETGGGGEVGEVKTQATPAATWNFPHGLGRLPTVSAYLLSGEEVGADVTVSDTDVYVTWPEPIAGKLVLT